MLTLGKMLGKSSFDSQLSAKRRSLALQQLISDEQMTRAEDQFKDNLEITAGSNRINLQSPYFVKRMKEGEDVIAQTRMYRNLSFNTQLAQLDNEQSSWTAGVFGALAGDMFSILSSHLAPLPTMIPSDVESE